MWKSTTRYPQESNVGKSFDWQELKAALPIEQAISMLNLDMKKRQNGQWRGACPCKKGGPTALSVTPEKQRFYCFGSNEHGDIIAFVSHIKQIEMKAAAEWLHDSVYSSRTIPEAREGKANQTKKLEALSNLESDHEAVSAVGFDTDVAARLGIGFRTKGAGAGSVLIPVRNQDGVIEGYVGVTDLAYIPKDFQPPENVVKFPRRKA
jgi:hypothetical protein